MCYQLFIWEYIKYLFNFLIFCFYSFSGPLSFCFSSQISCVHYSKKIKIRIKVNLKTSKLISYLHTAITSNYSSVSFLLYYPPQEYHSTQGLHLFTHFLLLLQFYSPLLWAIVSKVTKMSYLPKSTTQLLLSSFLISFTILPIYDPHPFYSSLFYCLLLQGIINYVPRFLSFPCMNSCPSSTSHCTNAVLASNHFSYHFPSLILFFPL